MAGLSISKAWEEAKDILVRDGKLIASVALALIVLPEVIGGLVGPPPNLSGQAPPSWMPLVALIVGLLGIAGQIAIVRMALGPSTTVGDAIAHGFRRLGPVFLALILLGLALALVMVPIMIAMAGADGIRSLTTGTPAPGAVGAIGLVALIALFIFPRFQMIVPAGTAEAGGPLKLVRRSWDLTSGQYLRMLAFLLLILVVAVVVVLFLGQVMGGIVTKALFGDAPPFSVGALVAALLSGVASAAFASLASTVLARMYVQLSGRATAKAFE